MATATTTKSKKTAKKDSAASARKAAIMLKQISDPTRLLIVLRLSEGERSVGSMCDELNQTQPAVSHHLALLRHGGVVEPRRQGKNNFYALTESGDTLAAVIKELMN